MLQRLWLAISAAYIALLPQFYLVFSAENRFYLKWALTDHVAVICAIGLLGFIGWGAYEALRWGVRARPVLLAGLQYLAVLVLFFLLTRTALSLLIRGYVLPENIAAVLSGKVVKLLYYVLLPAVLLAKWRQPLTRAARALYLLLSPLVILLCLMPLVYPMHTYESVDLAEPVDSPGAEQRSEGSDIIMVLFDAWSYHRTFPGGVLRDDLPHLREVLETANVYHQAFSPSWDTLASVPRLLMQNDPGFTKLTEAEIREYIFAAKEPWASSIFSEAKKTYFTAAWGFNLGFERLVGSSTDFSKTVRPTAEKPSFGHRVRLLLTGQLTWLRHFGVPIQLPSVHRLPEVDISMQAKEETERIFHRLVQTGEEPLFAFVYYLLPHCPFVWDREGRKPDKAIEPYRQASLDQVYLCLGTPEQYLDNLRQLDSVLGRMVADLKAAGRYDHALIILTGDHTWRVDPDRPWASSTNIIAQARAANLPFFVTRDVQPIQHVSLVVKLPGQQERRDVWDTVASAELYPIIEAVVRKQPVPNITHAN